MKNDTRLMDSINNIIVGNQNDYHCSFCQKLPACCLLKDGTIFHSSYCDVIKEWIAHEKIEQININTDCLIIYNEKLNKYSGRGYKGT